MTQEQELPFGKNKVMAGLGWKNSYSKDWDLTLQFSGQGDSWVAQWIENHAQRWEVLVSNLDSDTSQVCDPGQVT